MNTDNNIPQIIEQAAKSTLGVFSLMIIALSIIAFVFFKRGSQRIKLSIFLLLFAGVACFGVAISRQNNQAPQTVSPVLTEPTPVQPPQGEPKSIAIQHPPTQSSEPAKTNQQQTNADGTAIQIGNARDVNITLGTKK